MAGEDPDRVHFLHSQACACHPCPAPPREIEVNHPTYGRGLSQRGNDKDSFPMCGKHHRQFHAGKGYFEGWSREKRRAWQIEQAQKYQGIYDAALARGEVAHSNPDDKRARTLCRENDVPPQVEFLFVRLVREAADWGVR